MSARHVIADALSARREELTGEASPLDHDGARLVLRYLERAGFTITKTDDGAAEPGQGLGGSLPGSPPAVSSSQTGPGPDRIGGQPGPTPRVFWLDRHRDVSHVSGTGVVAWGVQFPDGAVAVRWHGAHPSTVAWPSVEDAIAIHGHSGATELRWLGGEQ